MAARTLPAAEPAGFDAAAAFGARPAVTALTISPDGQNLAWIAADATTGAALYTLSLAPGAEPRGALYSSGKPERLQSCSWVSNERLVCRADWLHKDPAIGILPFTRTLAVNADGSNVQVLSTRGNGYSHGMALSDGHVLDWLPDKEGAVLMARLYRADTHTGTLVASAEEGLGVDEVDTRNLKSHPIEKPRRDAWQYITDGRGHVRIIGLGKLNSRDQNTGAISFQYHTTTDSAEFKPLATWDTTSEQGFRPEAVDPDLNVAYGFKKLDGRLAVYSISLDGTLKEELRYANPAVDVMDLVFLGRQHRVVGATYITDYSHAVYFAPDVQQVAEALHKALHLPVSIVSASEDEKQMVALAGSDTDPGTYYLFDRRNAHLRPLLEVRPQLHDVKLATQKPVTYAAADGTIVPAYLTLPPGVDSLRGLPAIVMPHGGPEARDFWGFDYLPQFFANRGYAVLQPEFRGSVGYGDAWFKDNGYKSYKTAIGDVLDGGRWLVKEGADPSHLGIFGWSYGGYAALQSAVEDPTLFKAVIAVAPVTDLESLKEEWRHWSNFELESARIGEGPEVREGSPAQHADRIRAPVLLFHGTMDRNVNIRQSQLMESRLKSAGKEVTLVTFDDLDHQLPDSKVRAELLRHSDAFLRKAFGM
ncbi:MAG: S9 family peptidase [Proteobacteria bacterium]|nr:S9 family peptidase [Pseudomonadota bacterium]